MKRSLIIAVPVLGGLVAVLYPITQLLGVGKPVQQHKNQRCQQIQGLEGCEDAWISYDAAEAYLPCSARPSRQAWLPAILHLNATALPEKSVDYVAVLDLNTNKYRRLRIVNAPSEVTRDLNTHAIEGFHRPGDRDHLTIFMNSHRPPSDRSLAPKVGADSVIEVFETRKGSDELRWVKTVRDPLIRTPNNLVAMSETSFYVTNDHRHKVHWTRAFSILYHLPSDIIYCDISGPDPKCSVAAEGVYNPNGIARGPRDLLYQASSGEPYVTVYEIQSGDHSLVPVDRVKVGRIMDNLHVGEDGAVYVNTFPHPLEWLKASKTAGQSGHLAPTESWRIRNNTDEGRHLGNKYKVELAFADDGTHASGPTTCAPWKNKLLLTGIFSKVVTVCDIS